MNFWQNRCYYLKHPFKLIHHWWRRQQVPGPVVNAHTGMRLMVDSLPTKIKRFRLWLETQHCKYPYTTKLIVTAVIAAVITFSHYIVTLVNFFAQYFLSL